MGEIQVTTDAGPTLDFEPDFEDTDRRHVYLDGTLVLVGCGKAKRDPTDPTDLHVAEYGPDEPIRKSGPTGPAWRAEDLYTSPYFGAKREFAELLTRWARPYDSGEWAILSAEHGVVQNWEPLTYYDTSINDLGDDPTNPDHRVENSFGRRRPDGQEIVTEMDAWAARVATTLCKWVSRFRPKGANPWENDANELLVLAGQDYIEPLRERGVFEYGIARMTGNPNGGYTFPLAVRYLFEEIPAGGNGEQMGWLSTAIGRIEDAVGEDAPTTQRDLGAYGGDRRACVSCGTTSSDADALGEFDGVVYCRDCEPIGRCKRCDEWTHETGLGRFPVCPDCQTDHGGMRRDSIEDGETYEQTSLTDGGECSD